MDTRVPTLPPLTSEMPPRMDPPPARRRRRRGWLVVLIAMLGALALIASAAVLNGTALRHDLLPMETFDSGTGSFDVVADDGAGGWAAYRDGAYVVHSGGDFVGGTASLTRTAYALRLAVDVTIESGTGTVLVSCAGNGEGQLFLVNTDGSVALMRVLPGGRSSTLAVAQVPALEAGVPHHLLVTFIPPGTGGAGQLEGSIDGRVTASAVDPGPDFAINEGVLMVAGAPLQVRFDNVEGGLDEAVS